MVPYIAAYVTQQEQEKFNRRVISNLGLLNSQVIYLLTAEAH